MTSKAARRSSEQLSWFAVSLVFECIDPDTDEGLSLEQRIVLLHAVDEDAVRERAGRLGKKTQVEYASAEGNQVRWLFRGIGDIKALLDDEIGDGTEVYYSYLPIGPTPGFQIGSRRPASATSR